MKKLFVFISMFGIVAISFAQYPTSTMYYDYNNINVLINSASNSFWDATGSGSISYEIPKGSGKHAIFCNDIWLGGLDSNDSLFLSGQRYLENGPDYYTGPIANNYDNTYDTKYNNIWVVTKAEIDYHIVNINNGWYTVPSNIIDWPTHGNTANGEAVLLAPYVDVNNNNIYDPLNGDYPKIKGDKAFYTIFNDTRDIHNETGGNPVEVEVHLMIYGFGTSINAIHHALFFSYKIYNRSANDYHDFKVGSFTDYDIGDPTDDYIGCDTVRNMSYGYNGDNNDGTGTGNSYGLNPPAMGTVFLNKNISGFAYFNNANPISADPSSDISYYNYLNNKWLDGSEFTFGGNGYGGSQSTKFIFPGDVLDTTQWSEVSANNAPGDRRGISVFDKGDFNANSSFCFDLAFVYGRNAVSNFENVNVLKQNADIIQNYYNTNSLDCNNWNAVGIKNNKSNNTTLVYPNPSNTTINVDNKDQKIIDYKIIDLYGKIVKQDVVNNSKFIVSVSSLPTGIYVLRLNTGLGFITKRIVKQ